MKKSFDNGLQSVQNAPKSDRPSVLLEKENVAKAKEILEKENGFIYT